MSMQLSLFDIPSLPPEMPPVAAAPAAAPEAPTSRPVLEPVAAGLKPALLSGGVGLVRRWPVAPSNGSNRKWFGFRDASGAPLLRVLYLVDHGPEGMRLAIPATGDVYEGGFARTWQAFCARIHALVRAEGLESWESEFLTVAWQGEDRLLAWEAE